MSAEEENPQAGSAGAEQDFDERSGPRGGRGSGRGQHGPGGGPRRGGHRGGFGRPGGWQHAEPPPADDAPDWVAGRLPSDWFVGSASVSVDREEIIVTGELPPVAGEGSEVQSEAAATGRISRFREDTRTERMRIAAEAEAHYGRKVSWGAEMGNTRVL